MFPCCKSAHFKRGVGPEDFGVNELQLGWDGGSIVSPAQAVVGCKEGSTDVLSPKWNEMPICEGTEC